MKVAVAMSGGVDSSMAAALLKERGYDVFGITMESLPQEDSAAQTARAVAAHLGIPHHVRKIHDSFAREVLDYFCAEYQRGRTPNHCTRCNRYIKFGDLRAQARELGAEAFATGHHARITRNEDTGRYELRKGHDPAKDQSYFLYLLTQEQLGDSLFPIGDSLKSRLKEMAREMGLPIAARESQEVCFVPGSRYAEFIREHAPQALTPGEIRDERGNVLGEHPGIPYFTVGQRKGLGIAAPEPLYVTAIDAATNTVIVGSREQTYARELTARGVNWVGITNPGHTLEVAARVRYRQPVAPATLVPRGEDEIYVKFAEPQMAITPGQAVVCYDNDRVLCGGTIESVAR
ncbi:MAG: tRNA 2-thiouridine(34) synthase MnmA [Chloroflexota bacterium]